MSLIAPHSGRVHVRLEHHAGKEPRFWEISVSGATVKTRYGRVGSDGQVSGPRHLASAEQAVRDAEKRIAAKLSEGYVRIGDPGEHLCEPALVQAIADAPDDEDGYLVYADWLQSRGDPRGDWIMIEHTLRRKPHDRKLITARRQLRREHGARMNPTTLTEVIRNQWAGTRTGFSATRVTARSSGSWGSSAAPRSPGATRMRATRSGSSWPSFWPTRRHSSWTSW